MYRSKMISAFYMEESIVEKERKSAYSPSLTIFSKGSFPRIVHLGIEGYTVEKDILQ